MKHSMCLGLYVLSMLSLSDTDSWTERWNTYQYREENGNHLDALDDPHEEHADNLHHGKNVHAFRLDVA